MRKVVLVELDRARLMASSEGRVPCSLGVFTLPSGLSCKFVALRRRKAFACTMRDELRRGATKSTTERLPSMNAFLFIWLALAAGFAVVKAFTGLRRAIRIANHKEVMPLFSSSLREIEASRVVMNDRLLSEWDCPVSPIKRLILISGFSPFLWQSYSLYRLLHFSCWCQAAWCMSSCGWRPMGYDSSGAFCAGTVRFKAPSSS